MIDDHVKLERSVAFAIASLALDAIPTITSFILKTFKYINTVFQTYANFNSRMPSVGNTVPSISPLKLRMTTTKKINTTKNERR
jgi:hypothetical protein